MRALSTYELEYSNVKEYSTKSIKKARNDEKIWADIKVIVDSIVI